MELVILESPYAGDVGRNKLYLQACIRDCLLRGESPYASHQMLTDALDDLNVQERARGLEAASAWYAVVERGVIYVDLGISAGMEYGIHRLVNLGKPVEQRKLGGIWYHWGALRP